MEPIILYIIIGAAALILGLVYWVNWYLQRNVKNQIAEAEQQAKKIIADGQLQAETLKKRSLEAKEKFVQLKADHDREVMQRNQKISESENRIKQKEQSLNQKDQNLEKQIKEMSPSRKISPARSRS